MILKKTFLYLVLLAVVAVMLLPFYWMLVLSTQTTTVIFQYPPPFWFGDNTVANFLAVTQSVNFLQAFSNTLIVSVAYTALVLLFCSMGGYAFAMYSFPGRETLFTILLVTLMIPWTVGIVPWFFMMSKFGWTNNFLALIVPGAANAFGIFWMRQYCRQNIPASLIDAAKIDGLSEWLIFFRIVSPLLASGFAALGIMMIVGSWNDFIQPMLILRDNSLHTLPLMLKYMQGDARRGTDVGALMLAGTMAILPLLIAFLSASNYFMSGLTAGAVKE